MKPKLSPRELELVRMFADGKSEKSAAQQLGIALTTVKGHSRNLRAKLGAANTVHAVAKSFRAGVLQ